jgi:hypothetical protein
VGPQLHSQHSSAKQRRQKSVGASRTGAIQFPELECQRKWGVPSKPCLREIDTQNHGLKTPVQISAMSNERGKAANVEDELRQLHADAYIVSLSVHRLAEAHRGDQVILQR